ncbi:MAG: radical SAM protein, partial [Parvibaculaceae bacterium]
PVDVNRAPRETLLRVPGLGTKSVDTILASRRHRRLRLDDIARVAKAVTRMKPFIVTADWTPRAVLDGAHLKTRLAPHPRQLSLF